MTDSQQMITSECPNGHRVRGTEMFLDEQVRCPRCRAVFTFAVPTSQAAPVIALGEEESKARTPAEEDRNARWHENAVSESSVMEILGDWTPPPPRPCPRCGVEVLGTQIVCHACGGDLSTSDIADSIETPVINTNQFEDLSVRRIMQPHEEIAFVNVHESLSVLQSFVRQTMHTRYLVCDQTLDQPLGMVHIKDILVADPELGVVDFPSIMTKLERIPERLPISSAFRHLQLTRQSIALVVNASGATTGIVTMKDILAKMMGVSS